MNARTRAALPIGIFAALIVAALLLFAALPAMAQAQEATPTPEAEEQEAAPTEEATPTPEAQTPEPAPTEEATPTPEAEEQEAAPTEEATPTPAAQTPEPAPTEEATPTPEAEEQEAAPTEETTPTPAAQTPEPAPTEEATPTPAAQTPEPEPTEETTPTPATQTPEPAPTQEATPAAPTPEPAPTEEATPQNEQIDGANSDPAPQSKLRLSQGAWSAGEADGALDITVNIAPALPAASEVNILTRYNGAATADDFSVPATLTLPQGATSATLRIDITDDSLVEGDESFRIVLSASDNAPYKLASRRRRRATITIIDDDRPQLTIVEAPSVQGAADLPQKEADPPPGAPQKLSDPEKETRPNILKDGDLYPTSLAFSQAAWSATEAGADGTLNVTVNINPALATASTVSITPRYDSAAATDVSVPATLTLPAGRTSVDLPITIRADALVEGAEKLEIQLSAVEGAPYKLGAPAKTTITINDDDFATLVFSQAAWSATEADTDGTLKVNVKINPAMANASAVNITTRYDSATAADVSVPATLTLPAGRTSVDLPITIRGDSAIEGAEKLEIELSAVAGAPYTLGAPAKTTITINDDDFAALAFSQAAWSATEADTDGTLKVNVSISPALPTASTVNIMTRHISTAAADVSVPVTLTLPAGRTSVDLPITIRADSAIEGAEKLEIELSAVAGAPYTLGAQAKTTITINDDDLADLSFEKAAYTVNEGDGNLDVIVKLSPALKTDSQVNIRVYFHGAATDADVSVPATLTLPKGATSVKLAIAISEDTLVENAEKFEIGLSAIAGAPYKAVGQMPKTTITIEDNDKPAPQKLALQRSVWTITVTPGDQQLDVSWQAPPRAKVSDISEYWVTWCLEKEGWGCNPTTRVIYPAADGSGSFTITRHFSPGSDPNMVPLINGARYRVYVRAMQGYNTSLATSESSYDNRPQASGDNP